MFTIRTPEYYKPRFIVASLLTLNYRQSQIVELQAAHCLRGVKSFGKLTMI